MKLEEVDVFSSYSEQNFSCVEYVREDQHGYDLLFVGTFCGHVKTFLFTKRKVPRTLRPEDISRDLSHGGQVTCLMHSSHPKLSSDSPYGVLYSGSSDRTIKVWMPNANGPKLLQTLYGHEGSITQIADSHDGTILSISVDGTVRLWKPQRGRNFLSQAFLECTCVVRMKGAWLTSMAVNALNSWSCYIADLDGNVEIYKKGSEHNEAEHRTAIFIGQLAKYKRWEKVHRLGITGLELVVTEHLLVTLSSDFTAKILDMHLGTTLHTIVNPRNCKYTGIVWNVPKFQMYLSDEQGYLQVWSSFYERTVETFVMSKWNGSVRVGRGDGVGPKANLLAQPLVSSITQHKLPGHIVTLHPRDGHAALWQIADEGTVAKFSGHDGKMILSVGIIENPSKNFAANDKRHGPTKFSHDEGKSNELISLEESTFISVGEDNIMRCWDEYDRSERYSIRLKHSSEVVCVLTIWELHSIVTGHDCGAIFIWNIDSGTKVMTNDMKGSAITAFAVGKNKHHDDVLLAVDRDGKIGVWNLTLFKSNLSSLPLELISMGFHDAEDPSIMSVDSHIPSSTVFTGGSDGHIKFWRLQVDHEAQTLDFHEGHSIWSLYGRRNFLLSGDESGRIVLWAIEDAKTPQNVHVSVANTAVNTPAKGTSSRKSSTKSVMSSMNFAGERSSFRITVTKLASWSSAMVGSFQCCYLDQVNGNAYVCLADVSCDFSTLYRISRRGGGTVDNLSMPTEGDEMSLAIPRKDKRQKRVSIQVESNATVSNTALDGDREGEKIQPLSMENLKIVTEQLMEKSGSVAGPEGSNVDEVENDGGLRAAKVTKTEANTPTSMKSFSATCSRRSSYSNSVQVYPSLLTIQLNFESIATIEHEGVEPSCMRCRVGKSSTKVRMRGVSARRNKAREDESSEGAETCVYLGLMDGSIQKHILGEIY